jgi:quercetin dioxygenase-like cupin family protein
MTTSQTIAVGEVQIRYLVDGSADGKPGLFELTVPPGARVPPPHHHAGHDEYIVVTAGVLRYRVGAEVRDLQPGEHMVSPRGVPHAFANPGTEPARALVTQFPDLGPQYFRDIASLLGGGPPDPARIAAVMARYGLVPELPR